MPAFVPFAEDVTPSTVYVTPSIVNVLSPSLSDTLAAFTDNPNRSPKNLAILPVRPVVSATLTVNPSTLCSSALYVVVPPIA